jgi:tripartite-type tricarboxylate transporter receptor subunit TctC
MLLRQLLVAAIVVFQCLGANAQVFPDKPIRIVVPFSPGGTNDVMARRLQAPLLASLGQPIVVENRTGAAGAIGTRLVAQSQPDGYTMVFGGNGPHSILPAISKDLGYDGLKSFSPIALLGTTPGVLIINSDVPANDLASFIAYARSNPGKLEFSTSGIGTLSHLATEDFARRIGTKFLHVPYKGQADTVTAVVSKEVKFAITTPSPALLSHVTTGRLKILAVSSAEPSPLVPGIPPIASALPGFNVVWWFGLLAPAGTPPAVVTRLNEAIQKAIADSEIQRNFRDIGVGAKSGPPDLLTTMISDEMQRWADLVKETNIKQ